MKVRSIPATASDDDGIRVLAGPLRPGKAGREKTVMDLRLRDRAPGRRRYHLVTGGLITGEDFPGQYPREPETNRGYFPDLREHDCNGDLTLLHGTGSIDCTIAVARKMYPGNNSEKNPGTGTA